MSNAEHGISQTQTAAARNKLAETGGLEKQQKWSIAYLDERVFYYAGIILFLGLLVVWATASSTLVLYGSLLAAIGFVVLWGVARVKRLDRVRQERAAQAAAVSEQDKPGDN